MAENTINPANGAAFSGGDPISSLASLSLSNGADVAVNGSLTPTLDIRAGIDWTTFTGGAPVNQVIPPGGVNLVFSGATGATITVTGGITITQPEGMVLLTNQYRPNGLAGSISTGDIDVSTTFSGTNAGSILLDTRGDLSSGALAAHAEVLGTGVTAGNGGRIAALAPNGSITSDGDLTAHTNIPGNQPN